MPRTPAQLHTIREERRSTIVQAALVVFARHGYTGASIRLIAQEAQIAQGLLYSYFESKDAVLKAIMERGMADVYASFADAEQATEPRERIERLIRRSFELVAQHQDFWRLSYSVRMQPEVLVHLQELLQDWTTTITAVLEQHVAALGWPNPTVEAALLFAQIDGVAQHYVMSPTSYPLAEVIDAMIARYTPG